MKRALIRSLHPLALLALAASCGLPAASAAPAVRWRELLNPSRVSHVMVWDTRRDQGIMIGGDAEYAEARRGVWRYAEQPGPHWEPVDVHGDGPTYCSAGSAVYDSVEDRVLFFGGRISPYEDGSNELWELRLESEPEWRLLEVGELRPDPRFDAAMILDRERRLVLVGGQPWAWADTAVWVLSLDDASLRWRRHLPSGPGPRAVIRHAASYSPRTHRMLIFGGESRGPDYPWDFVASNATWELSLGEPMAWIPIARALTDSRPRPQVAARLVTEPQGRWSWLFPGFQDFEELPYIWRYDHDEGQWTLESSGSTGPGIRAAAATTLVPGRREVWIDGGTGYLFDGYGSAAFPGTYAYSLDTRQWRSAVSSPFSHGDPHLVFDEVNRSLVTWTAQGRWTMRLDGAPAWQMDASTPGWPQDLWDPVHAVDPVHRRVLVFGGFREYEPAPIDRVWTCPLTGPPTWEEIPIEGELGHTAWGRQHVYDPVRERLILLRQPSASYRVGSGTLDTLWSLELQAAVPRAVGLLAQGPLPVPRQNGSLLWDGARGRALLHAGGISGEISRDFADLWTLDLSEPTRWSMNIPLEYEREGCHRVGFTLDPTLDRAIRIGGVGLGPFSNGWSNAIRAVSLDDPTHWIDLDPDASSPMRGGGTAVFDTGGDRILWWDGMALWELTWPLGTPASYPHAQVSRDAEGIHVRWAAAPTDPYVALVERSTDGGATWSRWRSVAPRFNGSLEFRDPTPPATGRLAYRASIERRGARIVLGTASLASGSILPSAFVLAPPRPNPASDDVTIELASPIATQVTLEVFDLSGRRVGSAIHRDLAAGSMAFTIPLAHGLRPGLYLLRASDGRRTVKSRLAVVR